jgi:hypothetical protein
MTVEAAMQVTYDLEDPYYGCVTDAVNDKNMGLYTLEAMRARPVGTFDTEEARKALAWAAEKQIGLATMRIGGGTLVINKSKFCANGTYVVEQNITELRDDDGNGFQEQFNRLAADGTVQTIAISAAGPVDGTNFFPTNLVALRNTGDGTIDFSKVFPEKNVMLANDAVTAVVSAISHNISANIAGRNLIVQILGNGNGLAAFNGETGEIFATEVGHLPAGTLNQFKETQTTSISPDIVPIESICSGPAIERAVERMTGVKFTNREIDEILQNGPESQVLERIRRFDDDMSSVWARNEAFQQIRRIVTNGARAAAQQFKGVSKALRFDPSTTSYFGHGSFWKSPKFTKLVQRILNVSPDSEIGEIEYSGNFDNTGNFDADSYGAAVLAVIDMYRKENKQEP